MQKPPSELKRTIHASSWCKYIELLLDSGRGMETFYMVESSDYLGIVARTPSGQFPLVYQYRPAALGQTMELPAGTLEPDERPEDAAIRELKEETGLTALKVEHLGTHCSDSGRLTNRIHSFYIETLEDADPNFVPEPGMRVEYVPEGELIRRAMCGEIHQLLHLGTIFLWLNRLKKEAACTAPEL